MKNHKTLLFYDKRNKNILGYFLNVFELTFDITKATKFDMKTDLIIIGDFVINKLSDSFNIEYSDDYVYRIMYNKFFNNIHIDDIGYDIIEYEKELRRIKIKQLKND